MYLSVEFFIYTKKKHNRFAKYKSGFNPSLSINSFFHFFLFFSILLCLKFKLCNYILAVLYAKSAAHPFSSIIHIPCIHDSLFCVLCCVLCPLVSKLNNIAAVNIRVFWLMCYNDVAFLPLPHINFRRTILFICC